MNGRRIARTKSWPYEKIQNEKMSGRKNVKTKKYTKKKTRDEKSRNERMRNENLRTKKSPTKIGPDENRSWHEMCLGYFVVVKASELGVFKYLAKNNCYLQISIVYFHWKWCRYCSWKLTVIFGSVRILANRVNCPCPEQGRTPNSQLSSAISPSILPIEPQDHNQLIHRNPVNGLVMIFRFSW